MIWTLLDWISGTAFGIILVFSFLRVSRNRETAYVFGGFFALCSIAQGAIALIGGSEAINMMYPLIVHLPLVLLMVLYYKNSIVNALCALLVAYIFMEPRNLLGDIAEVIWPTLPYAKDITKILLTVPLLLLLLRLFSPYMRKFLQYPARNLFILLIPCLMYYCIIYFTTVYTHVLYSYSIVSIGLIGILFALFIFAFCGIYYQQLSKTMLLEERQRLISLQAEETSKHLEEMRYSQAKTKMMRHDLRHYFQMMDTMLSENRIEDVRSYIRTINTEIDETMVKEYCANESVNLILSSYSGKAKKQGIDFTVNARLSSKSGEQDLDICVILANGVENAMRAALQTEKPWVCVDCNMFQGKTVVQIKNSCAEKPNFVNGLPKSERKGHGIGTTSIVALAEKHGGITEFKYENGTFILNVIL